MEVFLLILVLIITILNFKKTQKIMGAVEQIQTEIQAIQQDLDAKQAAIETAFANLQAAINNGNNDPALAEILANLQAVRADVNSTVVPETTPPPPSE